jgi:hypothetical protein
VACFFGGGMGGVLFWRGDRWRVFFAPGGGWWVFLAGEIGGVYLLHRG